MKQMGFFSNVAFVPCWTYGSASVETERPRIDVAEGASRKSAAWMLASDSSATDPTDYGTAQLVGRIDQLLCMDIEPYWASHFEYRLLEVRDFETYIAGNISVGESRCISREYDIADATVVSTFAQRVSRVAEALELSCWPLLRSQRYERIGVYDQGWRVVLLSCCRHVAVKKWESDSETYEIEATALETMSKAQNDVERFYQELLDEERGAYRLVRDE